MSNRRKYIVGLIVIYILMYIVPLGVRPMLTPDEFRYGEIPREMIANNDWIVPRLNGLRYFEKPVLGYWVNAVSLLIFGENAFGVRFPTAFATGLTALLVWLLVKRFREDDELAFFATGIFLTSGLVYGVGTFATLDAITVLFLTGGMMFFLSAWRIPTYNKWKVWYLVLFGVCCGLAFLAKGFLGFVVPGLAIAAFLAWEKRWFDMFTMPWLPLIVAILVILPWGLAIHFRESDYWHYFVWVEHIERFMGKNDSQHPEPFWLYMPILLGGMLPWVLLLPAAFWICRKQLRSMLKDRLFRFCFCALVFPFIFFSACSGKLGTYILPCFPFIAVMLAYILKEFLAASQSERYYAIHTKILLGLMVIALVGFIVAQCLAEANVVTGLYHHGETLKWIVCVVGAIISMAFLWKSIKAEHWGSRATYLVLFAVGPFMLSMLAAPNTPFYGKAQGLVLDKIAGKIPSDVVVIAHRNVIHAACWVLKRDDIYLYGAAGEMEYGIKYGDSKHRFINAVQLKKMISETPKDKLLFIMRGDFREGIPPAPFEIYDHDIMISLF